jgi:chromosome segregation ATPase
MSQINELQARITAALDRIAQGLEGRPVAVAEVAADPEELTKLREQLEEERLANAQLQERIKALHTKLDAEEGAQAESLRKLDADLQSLRKANQQLRDNNQALREAQAGGVAEPHLINKAMMAELEGLRAARGADRGEVEALLGALGQVIAEAASAQEQTEKTETSDA